MMESIVSFLAEYWLWLILGLVVIVVFWLFYITVWKDRIFSKQFIEWAKNYGKEKPMSNPVIVGTSTNSDPTIKKYVGQSPPFGKMWSVFIGLIIFLIGIFFLLYLLFSNLPDLNFDLSWWWILIPLGLLALFGLYKLLSKVGAGGFWDWLKSSIWTLLAILAGLAIAWWIIMRVISWWNSPDPIDVIHATAPKTETPSEAITRFTGRSLEKGEIMLEKDVPYGFYVYESKTSTEGCFSFFNEFWNCGKMTVLPRQGDFLDVVFTVNGPTNCSEGYSYNIRFKAGGETEWYGRHGKLVPGVYTITANRDFYAKFDLNY